MKVIRTRIHKAGVIVNDVVLPLVTANTITGIPNRIVVKVIVVCPVISRHPAAVDVPDHVMVRGYALYPLIDIESVAVMGRMLFMDPIIRHLSSGIVSALGIGHAGIGSLDAAIINIVPQDLGVCREEMRDQRTSRGNDLFMQPVIVATEHDDAAVRDDDRVSERGIVNNAGRDA